MRVLDARRLSGATVGFLIVLAALLLASRAAAEVDRTAPAFDLPLVSGTGFVRSEEVFPAHAYTVLVFWDSDCPHCVQSIRQCQEFYSAQAGNDIELVGIHVDVGEPIDAMRVIDDQGITFPQLWDVGGETRHQYGLTGATFALVLVDREGFSRDTRPDPEGDAQVVLANMLSLAQSAAAEETPSGTGDTPPLPREEGLGGLAFSGDERLRFLGIDSQGPASGLYGEPVQPGNDVLFRLELEMSKRLSHRVRVGGLLRISNEGEEVLESGPEYFALEWGSVFAELAVSRLRLRLGYYDIAMTPLTLMRWDWNDNPRIGGSAGCGCGATAGTLLAKSLEELGPDLIFEGASGSYTRGEFDVRLFYAIPRRARETTYREYRATGEDRAQFSLEISGLQAAWRRSDARTGSFWKGGLRMVAAWENRRSVDFASLGYPATDPRYTSAIATVDWSLPVVRSVDVVGEWIVWNEARQYGLGALGVGEPFITHGGGGIAGVVTEPLKGWELRCDYVRLDGEFFSPFAALSYQPDREGVRASTTWRLRGDALAASLFYKRAREIDAPEPNVEREKDSVFGASIDIDSPRGWGGTIGWLDSGTWRSGREQGFGEVRRALVAGLHWRPHRTSLLEAQYQRIDEESDHGFGEEQAATNLYSVYLKTTF